MRSCPRCGREHPDGVHFCSCGAFLDWDPPAEPDVTNGAGAPASQTATLTAMPPPPVAGPAEVVSLTLFAAEGGPDGAPVELTVPAGGRTALVARVRNQSNIVDSYALGLDGLPANWWTIDPPTAYLLPLGSREGYEEDVVIALHPPRLPEAQARRWPFTVKVVSQSHPTRVAEATGSLDIEAFWQIAALARPGVVTGRRGETVVGEVTNAGNAQVLVTVAAADAEGRCRFELPAAPVGVPPGAVESIPVRVLPRRPHVLGRTLDHRLDLVAQTGDDAGLAAPFPAVYRQRAWIPWWVPLVVLLLALVALAVYLLWPQRVEVPDVRKAKSAFVAQKRLEKEGLELSPQVRRAVRPNAPPGSVVDQAPAPGETVDEGEDVAIVVAAGRGRVRVPPVVGLRVEDADQKLEDRGLTLGAVTPELDPKRKIGGQLPRPGVRRRRGSPVSVVLAKRARASGDEVEGREKDGSEPGAAGVPTVAGASAAAAVKKLDAAGLDPQITYRISPRARDTVLGTDPPDGAPPPANGVVELIVSAGFPALAYDTATAGRVVDGHDGWPLFAAKSNASFTTGGSWAADGRRYAYVHGGALYRRAHRTEKPNAPPALVARARPPVTHVAFAPWPESPGLLAFVRRKPRMDVLCWTDLGQKDSPSCKALPGWSVTGLSWHGGAGKMLLSVEDTRDADEFGLLRLSGTPGSHEAADWSLGTRLVASGPAGRGVRAAAFAPEGDRVAVISNLDDDFFRVAIVTGDDLVPDDSDVESDYLPVTGCAAAWRPDGLELAVVQAALSCTPQSLGAIVRVRPAEPRSLETVALLGRHPAWQPMPLLSSGPGR
jgi:beta-lactam-binding protein with PASTA domain